MEEPNDFVVDVDFVPPVPFVFAAHFRYVGHNASSKIGIECKHCVRVHNGQGRLTCTLEELKTKFLENHLYNLHHLLMRPDGSFVYTTKINLPLSPDQYPKIMKTPVQSSPINPVTFSHSHDRTTVAVVNRNYRMNQPRFQGMKAQVLSQKKENKEMQSRNSNSMNLQPVRVQAHLSTQDQRKNFSTYKLSGNSVGAVQVQVIPNSVIRMRPSIEALRMRDEKLRMQPVVVLNNDSVMGCQRQSGSKGLGLPLTTRYRRPRPPVGKRTKITVQSLHNESKGRKSALRKNNKRSVSSPSPSTPSSSKLSRSSLSTSVSSNKETSFECVQELPKAPKQMKISEHVEENVTILSKTASCLLCRNKAASRENLKDWLLLKDGLGESVVRLLSLPPSFTGNFADADYCLPCYDSLRTVRLTYSEIERQEKVLCEFKTKFKTEILRNPKESTMDSSLFNSLSNYLQDETNKTSTKECQFPESNVVNEEKCTQTEVEFANLLSMTNAITANNDDMVHSSHSSNAHLQDALRNSTTTVKTPSSTTVETHVTPTSCSLIERRNSETTSNGMKNMSTNDRSSNNNQVRVKKEPVGVENVVDPSTICQIEIHASSLGRSNTIESVPAKIPSPVKQTAIVGPLITAPPVVTEVPPRLSSIRIPVLRIPCNFANCNQRFPDETSKETHYRKKHLNDPKPYQCQNCPAAYATKKSLTSHLARIHDSVTSKTGVPAPVKAPRRRGISVAKPSTPVVSKQESESPSPPRKSKLPVIKCTGGCDAVFSSVFMMQSHVLDRHTDKRPAYACEKCDRSYPAFSMLQTHINFTHPKTGSDSDNTSDSQHSSSTSMDSSVSPSSFEHVSVATPFGVSQFQQQIGHQVNFASTDQLHHTTFMPPSSVVDNSNILPNFDDPLYELIQEFIDVDIDMLPVPPSII